MAISDKDLNKIAAAGLRIDRAYNPEAGTLTYGGYNTMPKQTAQSGTSGAPSPTGGNTMTGNSNAMTGGNAMPGNTAGGVGVRNAMTAAGLDNSKIGWNNGKVTYNGADFLTPASVTDGVSYASREDIDKAIKGYMGTQGLSGIRDTLISRGIKNSRIGWNPATGMVTIDGKDAYKPETIIGDRSYAQDTDINKLTDTAYANAGDPIRMAKAYVAQFGLQNEVNWADGKLTIGGIDVPVMYNQDGSAFARQSDINKAVAQVKKNAGITGNQQVYDNWKDEYGDRIDDALDAVINRRKWSYDPYDDPAFLAYRDAYTREGNRAYQDAYASMAANTGGYGSSASSTAAGQQLNYYMQQLNDRIPELEQDSYYRWYNDQQLNREALNSLMSVADSDYNKAYQANRDAINDTNNANYNNYLRDIDARNYNRDVYESDREFNRNKEIQDREWAYQEQLNRNAVTQSNIDTANYERLTQLGIDEQQLKVDAQKIANNMDKMTEIVTKYAFSGNVNTQISPQDAEVLGISPKADGTYPTIMDVQVAYTLLENAQTTPYYTQATQQMQREVMQKQRQQMMAATAVLKGGTYGVVNSGAFSGSVAAEIAALEAAAAAGLKTGTQGAVAR